MKQCSVLIVDRESYDTLPEMPGVFVRAGYVVDVVCAKNSWLRRNRFVNTWIPAQVVVDGFVQQIIDLARTGNYEWIILGDDATIRIINNILVPHDPVAKKILPLSNMANREMLGSKIGLAAVCDRCAIPAPKTFVCTADTCLMSDAVVGYPLIVKLDQGHSGVGIIKCANDDELLRAIVSFAPDEQFIIQKYIDGAIVNTESLFKQGKLLAYAYSVTIETIGHEFGTSAVRAYYPCPNIEPIVKHIGSSIGLNGFVNMTFMRDRITGEHFLIEADPRPQAWVPLAKFAGVNFLATGDIIRPTLGTIENPLIIRHFCRDMMRCIIKRDWQGIQHWIMNKDGRWKFIPWYDPVLFFWTVGRVVKFWWKEIK